MAETGYSGPLPRDYYNASGPARQENATAFAEQFGGPYLKPGNYKYSIVAVAHVNPGRPTIAARRIDFEIRVLAAAETNSSFWIIEHTGRAWARHARTTFHRFENGAVRARAENLVLPMMLRAPNNLLIAERLFDFDEKTSDVYTVHVPVTHDSDQELRRIRANGTVEALPPIPGIDTKRVLTLAVDGVHRRLWLALPNMLIAVSLDGFKVVSKRGKYSCPGDRCRSYQRRTLGGRPPAVRPRSGHLQFKAVRH